MPVHRRTATIHRLKTHRRRVYKKTTGRSRTTRRYKRYSSKALILSRGWENPLPQAKKYKFVYNAQGFNASLNLIGGWATQRVFRGNSLYDPDETGIGTQPYGYDNYCGGSGTPFGAYRVYASKISVYLTANNSETPAPFNLAVYPYQTAPNYVEIPDVLRIPGCKVNLIDTQTDDTSRRKLTNYCTTRFMFPTNYMAQTLEAVYNGNPSAVWHWAVQFDNYDAQIEQNLYFDVKIVYYAILVKQQNVNES